ncbi:MAG: TauD/TfdA family dioxygenase [Proteobacteria bacterium]|nr:TauD/TfdA family dioxygenase [Pseudomonadota bacterium]
MDLRPLSPALGAEVMGLDLSPGLAVAERDAVHQAWLEHGLLLFRGQDLDEAGLVKFGRNFGDLEPPPASAERTRAETRGAAAPEVWIISNVVENGVAVGALGDGEAEWHTDMSYMAEPPKASVLHAKEIPPSGGNTSWASMTAAYRALDPDLLRRIEGRKANHDSSYTAAGQLRKGADSVTDVTQAPGAVHPILRRHPETGEEAIYLGRRTNAYIPDLPVEESEELLDTLWTHCARPDFVYEHVWAVGDVVMWDNRSTIHRREAFDAASRRYMIRVQIKGDRPV